LSDSRPSLTSFETSDSLLEEFAEELALLDPFPLGKRMFINERALVCLPPLGDDDDDNENTIPLNELIPSSFAITSVLPTIEPEDSLIMGNEHLSTFPEKEMDEFIISSVEEIIPILSKSEVTSNNDKGCDLPFCDNNMILSNPLFGFNYDFTSSDDKSFLEEDILEDIKNEDSNFSNFDEPVLLNTPLFDEDECFDPGGDIDEINVFLAIDVLLDIMDAYNDSEGDALEILHNTTHNLSPEVFFDHEPQGLKDEPDNDDLMTKDKVFDPGIWERIFFSIICEIIL
ncbi:hypothetical protein Tco_0980422, partial [Tanacetum coccineum]